MLTSLLVKWEEFAFSQYVSGIDFRVLQKDVESVISAAFAFFKFVFVLFRFD